MALRGINLGGWLVTEPWITPSVYEGSGAHNEYQLVSTPGGAERLRKHHEQFITEDDIAWLAGRGIELLRVPIGYWLFGDSPPYIGTIERLDWLMDTASAYNVKVLLCLHAAPGAQNTAEHSGSGNQHHDTTWLKNKRAQEQTIDVLRKIAERYKNHSSLWGLELLNEPDIDRFGLRLVRFYRKAYRSVVPHMRAGTRVVFSDAFHPWLTTNTFWLRKKKDISVVLDSHMYYCFGEKRHLSFDKQLQRVERARSVIGWLCTSQPVMVGEWSGVLSYRVSEQNTRLFLNKQKDAYRQALVTCYWTYKTENVGRWNYRWMVENSYEL